MKEEERHAQQLLARFMIASTQVEAHLQRKEPLTDLQLQSLSLTVKSLQTFLESWARHYGKAPLAPWKGKPDKKA